MSKFTSFFVFILLVAVSKSSKLDFGKNTPSEPVNSSIKDNNLNTGNNFGITNDNNDLNSLKLPLEVVKTNNDQQEQELSALTENSENTLALVSVLFRHGNRTAESMNRLYPLDPYQFIDFYPLGLGQLTSRGKIREYNVGKKLRQRYNKFLGDFYYPQMLDARSTDTNRTKMSLELVLAGLFPPNQNDELAKEIGDWQPIPYNYVSSNKDSLLLPLACPNWAIETEKLMKTEPIKASLKKYEKVFQYLSKNTGGNITTFLDAFLLYYGLKTQKEYGLQLPEWTKPVYPEILEEMVDSQNRLFANDGKYSKKIYLYSAHENNIASVLISLGVYENQIPDYGSFVIFEFHLVKGVPGFKIYFDNWTGEGPKLLQLPGCSTFCPFNKFVRLINKELPLENENACGQ